MFSLICYFKVKMQYLLWRNCHKISISVHIQKRASWGRAAQGLIVPNFSCFLLLSRTTVIHLLWAPSHQVALDQSPKSQTQLRNLRLLYWWGNQFSQVGFGNNRVWHQIILSHMVTWLIPKSFRWQPPTVPNESYHFWAVLLHKWLL